MHSSIGVALIGAGRIGSAHARRLAATPGARLALIVDRDEPRGARLAGELGARFSTDPADAFDSAAVDAVVIATQVGSHAELAIASARAGKPFFLEKPPAHDLASGRLVIEAVEAAGVAAMVGFQRRFDPAYAAARARIEAGDLGRLEVFRGVGRDPQPPALEYLLESGDLLVDMGIHDLDSARFLVGEVRRVSAVGGALALPELARHGLFDTAIATLEFESGAMGTVEVGLRTAYGYEIRAEVLGEHGRLHIETDRRPDLLAYDRSGGRFDRPRGFEERFGEAYRLELEAFVRGLREEAQLAPDPADAWRSLRLAFAAQHALRTGEPVEVNTFPDGA